MKVYAEMSAGSVEYSRESAAVPINELIEALEQAREDGATHVVALSGNYRGAQYARPGTDIMIAENDENEDDE